MTLKQRIDKLSYIFELLQSTTFTTVKKQIVETEVTDDIQDDFNYCLEVLAGKHVFGFKFSDTGSYVDTLDTEQMTVRQYVSQLLKPKCDGNLTYVSILNACGRCSKYASFVKPIVNRTLRLGIGRSIMPANGISPMLAKKLNVNKLPINSTYFVTEKLDGNRCIAYFDGDKWQFVSRNGKTMYVDFDMSGLPTDLVYDGEVLSPLQTENSIKLHEQIREKDSFITSVGGQLFNSTSGLINTHSYDKDLVYNIFDIMMDDKTYCKRRAILNELQPDSKNVRILPLLSVYNNKQELELCVSGLLRDVVDNFAEGLMINIGQSAYCHTRTDVILKYKEVYSMDMTVSDVIPGTGKYCFQVGSIECFANSDDKKVFCNVGSGLNDEQRRSWSDGSIIGKVVEVEYSGLSQSKATDGTDYYSLRFPRLKRVRTDKNTTSIY